MAIVRAVQLLVLMAPALIGLAAGSALAGNSSKKSSPLTATAMVGCAADGQMGPLAAPSAAVATPLLPTSDAAALSYYVSPHLAVLAPRGWHCFELYGSSGSTLLVTPETHDASDLLGTPVHLSGPAVQLTHLMGGTSGRFEVARIAARIFPVAKPFVQKVIDEGLAPAEEFTAGPPSSDRLTRRTDTEVEFLTPGNREGIGTYSVLAKSSLPISGVDIWLPKDEGDLISLDVRLPPGLKDRARTIIGTVEDNHGTTLPAQE